MIACLDVHYFGSVANAAAIVAPHWESDELIASHVASTTHAAAYEPGRFFLRELMPLMAVIRLIDVAIDTYVIDGYCALSSDGKPGLGAHLHERLEGQPIIVGVAKNRFRSSEHAMEVRRGASQKPLFITAIGMGDAVAAGHVAAMAGPFRLPTLLKTVDHLARQQPEGASLELPQPNANAQGFGHGTRRR